MEANAGKSFQMQILFNIFPRISLHCKLVPVQYWEYEYGLLEDKYGGECELLVLGMRGVSNQRRPPQPVRMLRTLT